jgi:hypothetical protein
VPLIATVSVPANYGIHDTFVRDGVAFLSVWNTGLTILDVGGGGRGGTPGAPVVITTFRPSNGSLSGPAIHNSWWFHNPVTGAKQYLFLGQEGPGAVGSSSAGSILVLDVSNLAGPVEVASFQVAGAGAHNFWMNEPAQVLYAAYYNGGVVALDVSGVLSGDLAGRLLARVASGGPGNTYVWGVMLANGRLYASDMLSGFWQLDPVALTPRAGGNNVPERWGSDLWVHGPVAYSGTWGGSPRGGNRGDLVKIWRLSATGAPTLADSISLAPSRTISDVEVSEDGRVLVVTTEGGTGGIAVFSLADPLKPALVGQATVATGLHTASLARINGRLYAFAAKNPPDPSLQIYDITAVSP